MATRSAYLLGVSVVLLLACTAEARIFLPREGRFLSPDRAGMIDGPNLYQYVRGNPIQYADPSGQKFVSPPSFVLTVLDRLKANWNIGSDVNALDTRTDIEITFDQRPCTDMLLKGGADTSLVLGPRGGVDKYTVSFNLGSAMLVMATYF